MLVRTLVLRWPRGPACSQGVGGPRAGHTHLGPGNPVSSLPGAGYGSYGYGGNSATAGYSKCAFLLV